MFTNGGLWERRTAGLEGGADLPDRGTLDQADPSTPPLRRSSRHPELSFEPGSCSPACGSGIDRGRHGGLRRLDVHPHDLPDVAVRVLEAAAVHEAVILFRAG